MPHSASPSTYLADYTMAVISQDPMDQVSPSLFAAFIKADIEKWVPIVKASGATAD